MQIYENINQVQQAYLSKALASETPRTGVFIGGRLVASSVSDSPFLSAENCAEVVVAKVANKCITDGKVQDEAPMEVIQAPSSLLGGEKEIMAFTTPALGENNLKPTAIDKGLLSSTVTAPMEVIQAPSSLLGGEKEIMAFTTPALGENNLKPTAIDKGLLSSTVTFPAKHNFAVKSKPITVPMYQSVFGGYYTQEQLPEQDQAKCLEKYSSEVKQERNARIADTDDYERLSDITVKKQAKAKREPLTDEEKAQVTAYRKALRDFPETQGFPFVAFPEIPSCIAFECNEKIENRKAMEAMR